MTNKQWTRYVGIVLLLILFDGVIFILMFDKPARGELFSIYTITPIGFSLVQILSIFVVPSVFRDRGVQLSGEKLYPFTIGLSIVLVLIALFLRFGPLFHYY